MRSFCILHFFEKLIENITLTVYIILLWKLQYPLAKIPTLSWLVFPRPVLKANIKYILSCPEHLNRWPCHSLTHSIFTFDLQRATLETCDLWDILSEWWGNMTWPTFWQFWQFLTFFDNFQQFPTILDNFWQFLIVWTIFESFYIFWEFWQFWSFSTMLMIFDNFPQSSQFLTMLAIFDNLNNFWQF